jgi:hypothetical protein
MELLSTPAFEPETTLVPSTLRQAPVTVASERSVCMRIGLRLLSGVVLLTVMSNSDVSAHRVNGRNFPAFARALVQSPNASTADYPVSIFSTGLSVICFKVTNTSTVDARITAIGLELPGSARGYRLLTPPDDNLRLYEGVNGVSGFPGVTLDFVITTGSELNDRQPLVGIPPGIPPIMFCVSGPFDPATPIETMLNGVVVRFDANGTAQGNSDVGVWEGRPAS